MANGKAPEQGNAEGRALKGSRAYVQDYVNHFQDALNFAISRAAAKKDPDFPSQAEAFHWVSPLADENYREYRDGEFLQRLGIGSCSKELAAFWPAKGPQWDALARVQLNSAGGTGCLLVEAKAHLGEFVDGDITRAGGESFHKICNSLNNCRAFLKGDSTKPCWTANHYQICNRLAHLYFLNQVLGIKTWLIWLLTVDAPEWPDRANQIQWEQKLADIYDEIGLRADNPLAQRIIPVYISPLRQVRAPDGQQFASICCSNCGNTYAITQESLRKAQLPKLIEICPSCAETSPPEDVHALARIHFLRNEILRAADLLKEHGTCI